MSKTTTVDQAILKALKRAPKKGLTAAQIAERAGLKVTSTRTTLSLLVSSKAVNRIGATAPDGAGRPGYLYVIA